MYLMLQNDPVLRIDIDKGIYEILEEDLLPFPLRNRFQEETDTMSMEERVTVRVNNRTSFLDYLARRALSLDRENAKKILNALNLSQSQDMISKAKIAAVCKAVSMVDDYWLNDDRLSCRWEQVNPRKVPLNEVIQYIALLGESLTVTGQPHTPELTGQGVYAKAWMRKEDGVYLYKKSYRNGNESEREVSVSCILDCFQVEHVTYDADRIEGSFVCKCKNMSTDKYGIVPAEEVFAYCNREGIDFLNFALKLDAEAIYRCCIVDYLISNSDRHMMNWGFYQSYQTGHLLCCHPLFDHNNAFDPALMRDQEGGRNLIFGKSMKECARLARKRCSFVCTKPVKRSMFLSEEMYQSFMTRAVELGLYQKQKPTVLQRMGVQEYEPYIPVSLQPQLMPENTVRWRYQADAEQGEEERER